MHAALVKSNLVTPYMHAYALTFRLWFSILNTACMLYCRVRINQAEPCVHTHIYVLINIWSLPCVYHVTDWPVPNQNNCFILLEHWQLNQMASDLWVNHMHAIPAFCTGRTTSAEMSCLIIVSDFTCSTQLIKCIWTILSVNSPQCNISTSGPTWKSVQSHPSFLLSFSLFSGLFFLEF